MALDRTKTRETHYRVTYNSIDFGLVDDINLQVKPITKPITIETIGPAPIGKRFMGLEATITVQAREVTLAHMQLACPWWVSGSIAGTPSLIGKDLYDYVHALKFHPEDMADATEDVNFLKAIPVFNPMSGRNAKGNHLLVGFDIFPDFAQLPAVLAYYYIGAPPA